MNQEEQLQVLREGVRAWNNWREKHPEADIDFRGRNFSSNSLGRVSLRHAFLSRADFSGAYLCQADLSGASLSGANLSLTNLSAANLSFADLSGANFTDADLGDADLNGTDLSLANFSGTNLANASIGRAQLHKTVFANTALSKTKGLDKCRHRGPSFLDYTTLKLSDRVPLEFLRGCGLPDALIDYIPSLSGDAIQFYSCFISYSSKDQEFADRLHSDLQDKGVRCWFAPHDLPIGEKIWDGIDQAIRTRDKVLLILSESAITSDWVEDEVTTAFAEERRRGELVLFPVRLDNAVMDSSEPWAGKLRDNRNIGDFTNWKEHDAYKATLDRVLRDLKAAG